MTRDYKLTVNNNEIRTLYKIQYTGIQTAFYIHAFLVLMKNSRYVLFEKYKLNILWKYRKIKIQFI